MSNSNPRSRSPGGDSVYSNYSYYDPEQVRGSAPSSPLPNALPQPAANASKGSSPLAKGPSATPRSKSKHKGSDNGPSSEPRTAEDYLQLGIQHHLDGDLVESAYCFEISAKGIGALRQANSQSMARSSQSTSDHSHSHPGQSNDASKYALGGEEGGCVVGMLMWGLALRSGWGVEKDEKRGFKWLRRAAEHAVEDLELAKNGKGAVGAMGGAVQTELVLAIYEVGQCFFHGWGVKQDKAMAVSYFQVAAKLGDPDAQQELAFCLLNGKGCKKDKKEAAKWYRAAVKQGASDVGLAWIFKDKYM